LIFFFGYKDGNEFTEETYIDPNTGKRVNVVKKIIKDKDGTVKLYIYIFIKSLNL
jgi:hypothetical protein